MWLPQEMNPDKPAYLALAEAIAEDVAAGRLQPGDRLPTHRELADALGLNVSTITRGYREGQRRGLISGSVGRGTFVNIDARLDGSLGRGVLPDDHLIEMGLLTPLYGLDPDIGPALRRLAGLKLRAALGEYNSPAGLPAHRRAGAVWAARYGLTATAEEMVVCAGAQHALACCLTGLFRPGQSIACDALTYPGFKTAAAMVGLKAVPIKADDQGLLPDDLARACRRDDIHGLYAMPVCQNPTTVKMSAGRRDDIARLARDRSLIVIEDDAYALSCPDDYGPLAVRYPEGTVYLAGASKVLWPGLRICFAAAPKTLRFGLIEAVLNTIWMAPGLNAELVAHWIMTGEADRVMAAKRSENERRINLARTILPPDSFDCLPSSYFIWLKPPSPWTGLEFENRARLAGVNVFCAEKFAVGGAPVPAAVRVALSGPAGERELVKGLEVLADLIAGDGRAALPLN